MRRSFWSERRADQCLQAGMADMGRTQASSVAEALEDP